jgi:hypothetical protein
MHSRFGQSERLGCGIGAAQEVNQLVNRVDFP